jgi:hypothetical protein
MLQHSLGQSYGKRAPLVAAGLSTLPIKDEEGLVALSLSPSIEVCQVSLVFVWRCASDISLISYYLRPQPLEALDLVTRINGIPSMQSLLAKSILFSFSFSFFFFFFSSSSSSSSSSPAHYSSLPSYFDTCGSCGHRTGHQPAGTLLTTNIPVLQTTQPVNCAATARSARR